MHRRHYRIYKGTYTRAMPKPASPVSGFGFRICGFGFRVSGFGFRVSGLKVYHDEVGNTAARLACPIQEDHLVHKPPGLGAKGTQVTSERDGSSALHVSRQESVSPS